MELTLIQKIAVFAIPVIFAITLHEAAHGYIAMKFGDRTAWMLGRVTANPFKHIEIGAFESWDVLGVKKTTEAMKAAGYKVATWVDQMLAAGNNAFYKVEGGKKYCYDPSSGSYKILPGGEAFIVMSNYTDKQVWKNGSCRLYDLGNDVLGLQWFTKMGSIGGDVLSGIQTAIDKAEKDYKGLVIANEGPKFSAGANVGMIFMLAIDQEYDELDMAIRLFQNTMMRARYSSVPVVAAPHGLALGGACELSLHADKCCPAAETYTGLGLRTAPYRQEAAA